MIASQGLLFLHSVCEMLPISSSWHLKYFFQASSLSTHIYHIWLLPILLCILMVRSERKDFASPYILCATSLPAMLLYIGNKMGVIEKWSVPISLLHFLMGVGLFLIAYRQSQSDSSEPDLPTHLIWSYMGIGQAFGMMIPGISRLGTSLLPAMFFKMNFRRSLVISFSLDILILMGSAGLDIFKHTVVLPSLLEIVITSLGFSLGWVVLEHFQWRLIGLIGIYRVLLGIALFFNVI